MAGMIYFYLNSLYQLNLLQLEACLTMNLKQLNPLLELKYRLYLSPVPIEAGREFFMVPIAEKRVLEVCDFHFDFL